jgi:hypothetical protein
MTLDILEGDLLVVGGKSYPIKSCAEWETSRMNTSSFRRRMAIKDCSTKRRGTISSSNAGTYAEHLDGLHCTPLDPVNAEIQKRVALDAPMELLQTFVTDGDGFVHLVVEDIKAYT